MSSIQEKYDWLKKNVGKSEADRFIKAAEEMVRCTAAGLSLEDGFFGEPRWHVRTWGRTRLEVLADCLRFLRKGAIMDIDGEGVAIGHNYIHELQESRFPELKEFVDACFFQLGEGYMWNLDISFIKLPEFDVVQTQQPHPTLGEVARITRQ